MARAAKRPRKGPGPGAKKTAPAPRTFIRDDEANPHYRPSRANTRALTVYVDPAAAKAMKQIALDEDTSVKALMIEAVDAFLKTRGRPAIADPSRGA